MRKINVCAVSAFRQTVLLRHHVRCLLSKQLGLQQVAHPQPTPRHLVFIGRANSPRSRANLICAARAFRRFIQLPVIWKNQVRAIADMQTAVHVDSRLAQRFNLRNECGRIDDHAGANHRMLFGAKNSARDQLQHVAVFSDDDGVPGIVPARYSGNVIERAGKIVDDFAFSFIAPLCTHHYNGFHSSPFSSHALTHQGPAPWVGAAPFPLRHFLRGKFTGGNSRETTI